MIKHIWSVLCQKSVVDQQTNSISIFDVFEGLEVDINPLPQVKSQKALEFNIPVQYQVVSLWFNNDSKEDSGILEISLISPDKQEKVLASSTLNFPADKMRMRSINQIQGLPINKSGIYFCRVKIKRAHEKDFKQVAEIPLEIKLNINKNS